MKYIYLAGPMRGIPEFNFPAFFDKEDELFLEYPGSVVFNPAKRDVEAGFIPTGLQGTQEELDRLNFDVLDALAFDCDWLCKKATHVYVLPGWSKSLGAKAEHALALALGLKIMGAPE